MASLWVGCDVFSITMWVPLQASLLWGTAIYTNSQVGSLPTRQEEVAKDVVAGANEECCQVCFASIVSMAGLLLRNLNQVIRIERPHYLVCIPIFWNRSL